MIKIKDIKPGYIYKVRVPHNSWDARDPKWFDFKELVLAKDKNTIVAILLDDDPPVPKKDRLELLKCKLKDFFENDKEIVQKYEGIIIDYDIVKSKFKEIHIVSPLGDWVSFIKEYKKVK